MASSERAAIVAISRNLSTTRSILKNTATSKSTSNGITQISSVTRSFPFPSIAKDNEETTFPSDELLPRKSFLDEDDYIDYLIKNGVPPNYQGTSNILNSGIIRGSSISIQFEGKILGDITGTCSGSIIAIIVGVDVKGIINGKVSASDRTSSELFGSISGSVIGLYENGILNMNVNGYSSGTITGTITGKITTEDVVFNNISTQGIFNHKIY